jgi:hypothetical protein
MNALQLDEILDLIGKEQTPELRRAKFIKHMLEDKTIVPYLRMNFVDDEHISGLPEGYPMGPAARPVLFDKHIPAGMGHTCLRNELRIFKQFFPTGKAQIISDEKRIRLWIESLQGLQWQEVVVITSIKDRTLQVTYPYLLELLDLLGTEFIDPAKPRM